MKLYISNFIFIGERKPALNLVEIRQWGADAGS